MRPDALLASDWIGLGAAASFKDQDTIALLLGDDLCNEYKQSTGFAADLGWGLSSCTWNTMPGCNMFDFP
ncbi:hypothetical protein MLD38_002725 [Melastoma candidum]|nr:hypothetical protein MLD38_002725 [Melastoma candidum]